MTIPKEFRDKLQIDPPSRVRFDENENGEIVVRPVKRPSELRGALASESETHEQTATRQLRERRAKDKQRADDTHSLSKQDK
ncbi:AbrB/MazE/SpoVT family DNA-binding domain-containing protein [Haloarcula sp. H-GB4]|uniref:AbrB/MazE/SpoVT family DNA-binding domain-containing protein n=1 Tax=Haloarcula sp. H-GB4 TaxID=3069755 RepID=UPI0027AE3A3C|nr:AbrB/MazE/SpoVT family DNA-binding domain-containing protein [Haloarcula sp. H-GB4]MDQ2072871.1 AbrB/MazE/SpoVT family DNA-binding domain-containing protein [Haloarcula sp. H-GB4]